MKNLSQMLKQAQQMQSRMQEMQAKLEATEVEGAAGGGMVKVVLTGKGDLRRVSLDPSLVVADEREVLEDLLVAAHADAGLLAQLDQHAAAVRESLRGAERPVDAEGLAAYAKSVAAAAVRMGRPLPEPGHAPLTGTGWLTAEWHLMRLVAVCLIAESADLL